MKKYLFCAGILALAASCTEELDTLSVQQEQQKADGISFTVAEDAVSRGEFFVNEDGTSYAPSWQGDLDLEEDQISIFSTLTTGNTSADWSSTPTTGAIYKATESGRFGIFTAMNKQNVLNFDYTVNKEGDLEAWQKNPARFLAVHPAMQAASIDPDGEDTDGNNVTTFTFNLTNNALASQTQTNSRGQGVFKNHILYSATTGYPTSDKQGVGENVNLNFNRVLSGLVFKTKGMTEEYAEVFGKLTNVKIESLGKGEFDAKGEWEAESAAPKKSMLAYGNSSTMTVTVTTDKETNQIIDHKAELDLKDGGASTIELEISDAAYNEEFKSWNDDARAYMIVAPVAKRNFNEGYKVTYTFENGAIEQTFAYDKPWDAGKFYNVPALDIASYDYIVLDKTLIVNKGGLDAAVNVDEVEWNGTPVAASTFTTVVVNGEMNTADWTDLKAFTGAKTVILNDVTSIPAKAFEKLPIEQVESLVLPKVTTISDDFTGGKDNVFNVLTNVEMPAYQFPSDVVNAILFNANTAGTLKTMDISGVTDMTPSFVTKRTLAFTKFTALEEVKLNATGVKLSDKAFNGCTELTKVEGKVDMSAPATNAFNSADKLEEINLSSTVIPMNAFYGCTKLEDVLYDGKQVAPTAVGASAFEKCEALEYMDLSKVETIGKRAFTSSGLKGTSETDKVVRLAAATISDAVFVDCKNLEYVYFTNNGKEGEKITGVTIEGNLFRSSNNIKQVKFDAVKILVGNVYLNEAEYNAAGSKLTTVYWNSPFGSNYGNMDLFITSGEEGALSAFDSSIYTGTDHTLRLPALDSNNKATTPLSITFKSIKVDDNSFGK